MTTRDGKGRPDLTIVGGQSRRRPRSRGQIQVPVGFEKLLYRAAVSSAFRAELLEDPLGAAERAKVTLRASEQAMLATVPPAALERMIDGLSPSNPMGRKFMGLVAAAAASLAAGTAACRETEEEPDTGWIDDGFMNAGGVDGDLDVDVDADADTVWTEDGFINAGGVDGDLDVDADSDVAVDAEADIEIDGDADQPLDADADFPLDADTDPDADE